MEYLQSQWYVQSFWLVASDQGSLGCQEAITIYNFLRIIQSSRPQHFKSWAVNSYLTICNADMRFLSYFCKFDSSRLIWSTVLFSLYIKLSSSSMRVLEILTSWSIVSESTVILNWVTLPSDSKKESLVSSKSVRCLLFCADVDETNVISKYFWNVECLVKHDSLVCDAVEQAKVLSAFWSGLPGTFYRKTPPLWLWWLLWLSDINLWSKSYPSSKLSSLKALSSILSIFLLLF